MKTTDAAADARAWLVPLSGPAMAAVELSGSAGPATLGRGDAATVRLPADAEQVSRQHARVVHDSGGWRLADLGSRWGTFVNGVKLTPHRDVPLGEGDLVRLVPWTFHFTTRGVPQRGLVAEDDLAAHRTMVRSHAPADVRPVAAEDGLALLLEAAAAIHAADTEKGLAEVLLDVAVRGTGLTTAAVLRPLDAAGRVDVVACRQCDGIGPTSFSRSLIAAASNGVVAELTVGGIGEADVAVSVVQMGIRSAMCVPLMLGGTVAAYLYLDSRGGTGHLRPGAAPFGLALGRMAGLALANLKRVEVERRQVALELDLSAAAVAQRWILPQRVTAAGPFTVTGESRPGEYVGGDFFDVIRLDEHRAVVALGDVSGHGVAASVLMTAAQGFLHAALRHGRAVADAVTDLNAFLGPRRPPNSFLTLWVGVFDAEHRTVTYVNGGHGYAAVVGPGGGVTKLDGGQDCPLGFIDDAAYGALVEPLPIGGRAMVISDGIVEQFDPGTGGGKPRQFGFATAVSMLSGNGDPVAAVFDAVVHHAGPAAKLQDDATAVLVRW